MGNNNSRMKKVREYDFGTCLWEMPGGGYLGDGDEFLSMEGKLGSPRVEKLMREHAIHHAGETAALGRAAWIEGARKVTRNEHDDQMARMLDGEIPDWEDETRQVILRAKGAK